MIANDGEREGLCVRDGHGRLFGRGARHARRDPPERAREPVRYSRLAITLCLFAFLALLFGVTAGVTWLIAQVLPVWAAVPLALVLLFVFCWLITDGR